MCWVWSVKTQCLHTIAFNPWQLTLDGVGVASKEKGNEIWTEGRKVSEDRERQGAL